MPLVHPHKALKSPQMSFPVPPPELQQLPQLTQPHFQACNKTVEEMGDGRSVSNSTINKMAVQIAAP
eukprot:8016501-Ditylum_brightwellii.AAC.2